MGLSYHHVWQNTVGTPVTLDAHSYLVLNGGAAAYVHGGVFPDDSLLWIVPPNGFAVFETTMSLTYSISEAGDFLVDFSGRSEYSVMSAAVLLHVTPSAGDVVVLTANN